MSLIRDIEAHSGDIELEIKNELSRNYATPDTGTGDSTVQSFGAIVRDSSRMFDRRRD